ncbi:OmpW/AlkL family protein [Aestuariirhabdus sp. LZHN29]|uniref:OmpW/AlkL family protein n=1 Tax=Aestuariirhabdus sp. LZHN29 TaxID=3417462 RepID=UPI003CF4351D
MRKLTLAAAIMAATALISGQAAAYQQGDFILRAGAATVDPDNEKSDNATLNGASTPGTLDSIDSDTALGLTFTYMATDNVGIGLLAASPFEHEIKEQGLGIGKIGTAKHLPPTLTGQYFPLGGTDSRFQPYIGAGINFTTFFSEDASSEYEATLGASDLELDDSWGWGLQAGADYKITDNLVVNASVWKLDIETNAEFKGKDGTTLVKIKDIEIDPWVYMVGVGYKF